MIIRSLLAGFTTFVIWIIYLIDTGNKGFFINLVNDLPLGDKVGHFFVMGTLAYLVNIAMKCRTVKAGAFKLLLGSVIVFACVFAEEVSQLYIPGRTFSLLDLGSDLLGIWLFGVLAVRTYPFWQRSETVRVQQ